VDSATQLIALFFIIGIFPIVNVAVRRRDPRAQRELRPLRLIPRLTGESIESGRPLHLSLGSAAIGTNDTLIALAGADFLYELTRQVAVGDAPPLLTTSAAVTLPLLQSTIQRSYAGKTAPQGVSLGVRWYPQGTRSLAFAAALTTLQSEERLAGNVLAGRYGTELALILDATYRHRATTLAVSDRLEGQAIAYAMADDALIGEEIFAATGYSSETPNFARRTAVTDRLRTLLIIAIVLLAVVPPLLRIFGGEG